MKIKDKYLTSADNCYKYKDKDELKALLSDLDNPIIVDSDFKDGEYIEMLKYNYGLVYFYSTYDDYDCYGDGNAYYVKIIDGVKLT